MKATELIGWFREACTDWDGSQEHDLAEPVHVVTCGQLRQAADLIESQAKAIEELRGKFAPIAHYLEMRRQKPMDQLGDTIHAVNIGSQWEAELLLSDMINFADALASHSKEGEQG